MCCANHIIIKVVTACSYKYVTDDVSTSEVVGFRCGLSDFCRLLECHTAYVIPKRRCETNIRCGTSQKTTEFTYPRNYDLALPLHLLKRATVGTVPRLQVGASQNHGSIPGTSKGFPLILPATYPIDTRGPSSGNNAVSV